MNWNYDEFKTYLLLEASHGDMVFTSDEQEQLTKNLNPATYKKMYAEFSEDTDYERIQKIMDGSKVHCDTSDKRLELIDKVKEIFAADGNVDQMEKNLLMFLKKLM